MVAPQTSSCPAAAPSPRSPSNIPMQTTHPIPPSLCMPRPPLSLYFVLPGTPSPVTCLCPSGHQHIWPGLCSTNTSGAFALLSLSAVLTYKTLPGEPTCPPSACWHAAIKTLGGNCRFHCECITTHHCWVLLLGFSMCSTFRKIRFDPSFPRPPYLLLPRAQPSTLSDMPMRKQAVRCELPQPPRLAIGPSAFFFLSLLVTNGPPPLKATPTHLFTWPRKDFTCP